MLFTQDTMTSLYQYNPKKKKKDDGLTAQTDVTYNNNDNAVAELSF